MACNLSRDHTYIYRIWRYINTTPIGITNTDTNTFFSPTIILRAASVSISSIFKMAG